MKKKTSALLLNAFVFPGTGQWLVGRKLLAVVFISVSLLATIVLFGFLIGQARQIIASIEPGTVPDAVAIEAALRASLQSGKSGNVSIALFALMFTWLLALVDLLLRKQKNTLESTVD